ncbi:MAG TPA: putative sugar O-methyltransferase [Patescibacteria group bacterium]|nr:putative sugar O-methyltransferase [Patescibacteria group bacterium]
MDKLAKSRILEMNRFLEMGPAQIQPSMYWKELNKIDIDELEKFGFDNFKRNIVRHYFTGISKHPIDMQIVFLLKHTNLTRIVYFALKSFFMPKHRFIGFIESINYNFRTLLTWEYAKKNDKDNYLNILREPLIGNPPRVKYKKRMISMDLANSLLEYYSIKDYISRDSKKWICELGPGYGRNTYIFLKLEKNVRYILVDISPALYISERYLSEVFPDKKIFRFRNFTSYKEIQEEFESSDVCFILPSQLQYLPDDMIDLFINISSFHEMRLEQIRYYFEEISRVLKKDGLLYLKQWKNAFIPFENVRINQEDYPIDSYEKIYMRKAKIQTKFFEALLKNKK